MYKLSKINSLQGDLSNYIYISNSEYGTSYVLKLLHKIFIDVTFFQYVYQNLRFQDFL